MKLKNVEDLRRLLEDNGNSVQVGKIRITTEGEGQDIDFYVGETLVYWISGVEKAETLGDIKGTLSSEMTRFFENSEEVADFRKEKKDMEKKILDMEVKVQEAAGAMGKVEAYEKLLIGREVNIGR